MREHDLLTAASIEAWIADNEPDGVDKLAALLVSGTLGEERGRAVLAYFVAGGGKRLSVAARALHQSVEQGRSSWPWIRAAWALRAAGFARVVGQLVILLILIAIILIPFWSG